MPYSKVVNRVNFQPWSQAATNRKPAGVFDTTGQASRAGAVLSSSKPERALSRLRHFVPLLESGFALSVPTYFPIPSPPPTRGGFLVDAWGLNSFPCFPCFGHAVSLACL